MLPICTINPFMPRTRNIFIENIIFPDDIVYYFLDTSIDDQHLPLQIQ